MKILLTNDDGIESPGLLALHKELSKIGQVTVVAPDGERSSVGHAITISHPLWIKKVKRANKPFGLGLSGTPADCVKFGVRVLLKRKPDLVVSGINCGGNDGCSVFYSGTIAGAREGAIMGIPAMALSLATFVDPDFSYGAKLGARLAKTILRNKLPKGTFLSVNIPHKKTSQIKGIRVTRQGMIPIHGEFRKRIDPNLREYYWLTGRKPQGKKNLEMDTFALNQGYVTITPFHCDLTDYNSLSKLKSWKI